MSSLLERIDGFAEKASEQPWRHVPQYGSIITDGTSLAHMDEDNRRAYGGGLVCESVAPGDKDFICELVNAWPRIRAALLAGQALHEAHEEWGRTAGTASNAHMVAIARQEGAHAAAGKALAALFGEQALAVRPEGG